MDVRHLPLEHPGTYKQIRHVVIEALLPGLEAVVEPALAELPPLHDVDSSAAQWGKTARNAKAARTLALTTQLAQHRQRLAMAELAVDKHGMRKLAEVDRKRASNADIAETSWELVQWLLDGLISRDFPNKGVTPAERADAPFYLYRLAQKLAEGTEWRRNHAARCLQEVLYELSAEHTREKLQAHYGLGGDDSVNHITKVLRPVDRHQNGALHVLKNGVSFAGPVAWIVGSPYSNEEFRIRQAVKRWHVQVPWLMNWTDRLPEIRHALEGHPLLNERAGDQESEERRAALSDEALGAPLSRNKDIYLTTREATERKLGRVLQQLADLHHLGGGGAQHVEVSELLERLDDDALDDDGTPAATAAEPAGGTSATAMPNGLAAVYGALDAVDDPLVRVGTMRRLLKRIQVKRDRLKLTEALEAWWQQPQADGQSLFQRLGVKPEIAVLKDEVLARAAGMLPAAYAQAVTEALRQFDAHGALSGQVADRPFGALQSVTDPFVRAGAALRLLARVPDGPDRQRLAAGLVDAWVHTRALDSGLFAYLGLEPRLDTLTDDVLAWACDLPIADYVQRVDQAVARFDADNTVAGKPRRSS